MSKPITPVTTFVTHKMPHIDEVVAYALLCTYGEKMFPGIKSAKVEFWDAGNKTPDGRTWQQWLRDDGYLIVGCGGGCFDEHPTNNTDRKDEHCAATLVAEYLGVHKKDELQAILKYALSNDTKGSTNQFDLASLVTLGNMTWFDSDPQGAFTWATQPVLWHIQKQIKFFTETRKEFDTYAEVEPVIHNGREICIVSIESNDTQIGPYARSIYGASAEVVVQRNAKKQISITTKQAKMINLDAVMMKLRLAEMRMNRSKTHLGAADLVREGTAPGSECWYYDRQAMRIFNGSLSAPDVPPTKIPWKDVVEIIRQTLRDQSPVVKKQKTQHQQ